MMNERVRRLSLRIAALAAILGVAASPARAQWVQQNEQFYLPAAHNWVFRDNYMGADRLFNAFDYGHAILYETLYKDPQGPVERLEVDEYDFLTRKLLRNPPHVPLEEGAIEIAYVKLAPEAKLMFEWAHLLHRQLYDVLADERLAMAEKDAATEELLAYYKTRPDLAFSSSPKSMDLMDGQPYSLSFRERYPKFNGLIWTYHWLQVGLYEPLLVNSDIASRAKGVNATVGRFWQMLENAPENMPYLMPMTVGVAPTFAARYPEAAIIFDNLHMMHDVISDILASPEVPRARKRDEILRAAAMFRDDTSYIISMDEWAMMGKMMGSNNMGGPAVGFLSDLPQPTVPRGMSMAGMDHGALPGMQHDSPQAGHMQHAVMDHDSAAAHPDTTGAGHGAMNMDLMMEMHTRMLADPVIRDRIATDPVLQRMMQEMHGDTAGHRMEEMRGAGHTDAAASEGQRQIMEFIVRLLADPAVEARIHQDPALHRLWSDPAVQDRIRELRQTLPDAALLLISTPLLARETGERIDSPRMAAQQDSAAVAAVVDSYHRALATGDSAAALALLTEDAIILESGGVETRAEYRAGHLPGDIAFARAVARERGPIRVAVRGDVAWATSTSAVRGQYRDRAVNSAGAELMVLTRTAAGWKIAAIHWSSRALRN
jgi:ketosteroid isomerase-like protein